MWAVENKTVSSAGISTRRTAADLARSVDGCGANDLIIASFWQGECIIEGN